MTAYGCNHLIKCFKKSIKLGDTIELATQRNGIGYESVKVVEEKVPWTITGILSTMIEGMKNVFPHPPEGKHNLIFIIKLCIF